MNEDEYYAEVVPLLEEKNEEINLLEKELRKYRDIEEELGIDLVTLFKALKYGIYEYVDYGESVWRPWVCHTKVFFDGKQFIRRDDNSILSLNLYKKQQIEGWALTEKELQK